MATDPAHWNPVRADGKRECAKCGLHFRALKGAHPIGPHFDLAMKRWCPGGRPPTNEEKAARKANKKGRSIRAASGGLPTLGR